MLNRTYCWLAFGLLAIFTGFLGYRYAMLQIQVTLAHALVDTLISLKNSGLNQTTRPDDALEGLKNYYLPGSQLPKGSVLSEMVEMVRKDCIQQMLDSKEVVISDPGPPKIE